MLRNLLASWMLVTLSVTFPQLTAGQVVPGTGQWIKGVGDDFEDAEWKFNHNYPKSSRNIDDNSRYPSGKAANGRWYEGSKRGQPDYIVRVATPPGGLLGSEGSLALRSLYTGVPYRRSYRTQQDDFIANVMYRTGGAISASRLPNVVTRVFIPPFEEWEKRTGSTFAFRLALNPVYPLPKSDPSEPDTYWPGLLIDFKSTADGRTKEDAAFFRIRASRSGRDYTGPQIKETGWWTMGMSLTADGRVHYYARPGVEDLRPGDRIASHYPYGARARSFRTFFFNILSRDDGKTWSTQWIVDDPKVYVAN